MALLSFLFGKYMKINLKNNDSFQEDLISEDIFDHYIEYIM